jgi:uncharacterized membrane protein YqgA involved in biofilm formation
VAQDVSIRRDEIGTLLNTATVIVGALLGRAIGSRLPARLRETAMDGIALLTLLIGAQMALGTRHVLYVLGAVLIGGLLGEGLRIEDHLEAFGDWLERRVGGDSSEGGSNFSRGFVTTSILFCVGPVTLMGCIQDGLRGDYNLLAIKSVLDGFSALAFASALGWGVLFSAGTVLVVQGALTLGARTLSGSLTPAMSAELFATGGVMMLGLGIRLLGLKPVRVANFLPGLIVAPVLVAAFEAIARWRGG